MEAHKTDWLLHCVPGSPHSSWVMSDKVEEQQASVPLKTISFAYIRRGMGLSHSWRGDHTISPFLFYHFERKTPPLMAGDTSESF